MKKLNFSFGQESFNRLFPFYFVIDPSLHIHSFGKSLEKISPEIRNSNSFQDHFNIIRPFLEEISWTTLTKDLNQLFLLKLIKDGTVLRGQFELLDNKLLFIGTPWFTSTEQILERKLTMQDFALNDPMLDLLHLLSNQKAITQELNDSLRTISNQKNLSRIDKKELQRLSLIAETSEDGLIFMNLAGKIFWSNEGYSKLTGFSKDEIQDKTLFDICQGELKNGNNLQKTKELITKAQELDLEIVHAKKDGTTFLSKIKGKAVNNNHGEEAEYFVVIKKSIK